MCQPEQTLWSASDELESHGQLLIETCSTEKITHHILHKATYLSTCLTNNMDREIVSTILKYQLRVIIESTTNESAQV